METILVSACQILQFLQLNIAERALFHFIKSFGDENIQKVFILLEFMRYRNTCGEMIDLLRSTAQTDAANELEVLNITPGPMQVTNEVFLKVNHSKCECSLVYSMTKKPRGKCIVFNKIPELFKESQRFESIFIQLYFDVEPVENSIKLTSREIR
jgi:hypothetical protein